MNIQEQVQAIIAAAGQGGGVAEIRRIARSGWTEGSPVLRAAVQRAATRESGLRVSDYETGVELIGAASEALLAVASTTATGATSAYYDQEQGEWYPVPADEVEHCRKYSLDVRTVFTE